MESTPVLNPTLPVYVNVPLLLFTTIPLVGPVMTVTVNKFPSTSKSFVITFTVIGTVGFVAAWSLVATGASLTGSTVK